MQEFAGVCAEGNLEDVVSVGPGPYSNSGNSDGNIQGRHADETRGNWDLLLLASTSALSHRPPQTRTDAHTAQ